MKIARWVMRCFLDEGLAGDLNEEAAAGKSQLWLWTQIGVALLARLWSRNLALTYAVLVIVLKIVFVESGYRPIAMISTLVAGLVLLLGPLYSWKGVLRTWLMSSGVLIGLNYAAWSVFLGIGQEQGGIVEVALAGIFLVCELSGV